MYISVVMLKAALYAISTREIDGTAEFIYLVTKQLKVIVYYHMEFTNCQ